MPSLTNDEYSIHIKTTADLTGANEAKSALSGVQQKTKDVDEQSKSAAGGVGSLVGQFALGNLAANAVSSGLGMVKEQVSSVFEAADKLTASQTQLNTVLQSTHGSAGLNIQDLQDQSDALSHLTTFSKDQVQASEAMLLTFTDIKGAVYQQAMPAILDVSTAMHEDLQSASVQVGKALNDPATGMTALHRIGVTFTQQQKDQAVAMEKTGNMAGAQAIILKELNKEFGGSAQAQAQTYAGKMMVLKNNIEDMKASMGQAIEKGVQPLASELAGFVSSDKFQNWVKDMQAALAKDLPKAIAVVVGAVKDIIKIIGEVIGFYEKHRAAVNLVIQVIVALVLAFKTMEVIKNIINDIKMAWVAFQAIMEMNPIVLIITLIIAAGLLLMMHWKQVSKVAEQIWHDVSGFFTGLWQDITHIFDDVVNFVRGHWELILSLITGPVGAIVIFVVTHFQQILSFIQGIGRSIISAVSGFGSMLYDAGKDIINGLIHGVTDMAGKAVDAVKNVGKGIVNGAKDVLKIFSPSHEFADIGMNVGAGLIQGIQGMQSAAAQAAGTLAGVTIQGAVSVAGQAGNVASAALGNSQQATANYSTSTYSQNSNVTIGNVNLANAQTGAAFFNSLNNDALLSKKGLTPVQGMA